ncbi:peptidyl-dipeptidase Dcp [Maribellus sp. YY47]|uniref:peptidyl-dipeptidase Dcp n=1 Tax=Maribellus sp. YY47 TaxID=2929486 RepID=UPI0020005BFE|nr:peptidyl-dipeptidase Dcp [Maribellus sp. YY47]MCK3682915.1 peptidyl-dipeptidase Dcp [Maribellus sp. YY47]
MKKIFYLPVMLLTLMTACGPNQQEKNNDSMQSNPLLRESSLPFGAPDFTQLKNEDFKPAIEQGMKEQMAEIEAIANNAEPATFENTLVALEKSGQTLSRAYGVFGLLSGANTNPDIQQTEEELAPKLAAHSDAIFLNDNLFQRVKSIYNERESLNLDAESLKLVEYYYQKFELAGANLSAEDKEKMKKLNEEEASLSTKFGNLLIAAAKKGALVVDSKERLDGLSEGEISAAAQQAEDAGMSGQYMITLQNTTQQPDLQSLTNRETRRQLFDNSWNRAEQGDENDTRSIITRIAEIRAEQAKIMGFKNFAEWQLQDQMAKTPEAVEALLGKLTPAATAKAKEEAADIQKLIDSQNGGFELEAWDWNLYAEKVRKEKYDLDESQIKPYFELNNVMENGVFYAATQLYGITFKERKDIPVYQDDVRVWEIFDKDGSSMALFYTDYYKRDNKAGGAWMGNITEQSKLLGNKPVIYNVCNYSKPAAGEPALLSFDDVTTMFHEFGHALHGLFANQQYPSLSGTNVSRDFVELPSQFNEHWVLYPSVFANFAKHYKTGEPMPQELVEKIKKSATFNQGYAFTEFLAAAVLDMQWHTITEGQKIEDADAFELEALKKTGMYLKEVPPRYRSSYFLHIWGHGYAAGYYAYCWAEVLDNDAFEWFRENGGLTPENGQRFRDMILSIGNTKDLAKAYQDFRGKEADIKPLLKKRGLI